MVMTNEFLVNLPYKRQLVTGWIDKGFAGDKKNKCFQFSDVMQNRGVRTYGDSHR